MDSCIVCYDDSETNIQCQECNANTCLTCTNDWFRISNENKTIPKCPNCNAFFVISSLKPFKTEPLYQHYLESCYAYFTKDYDEHIRDEIFFQEQLEKLRKERFQFIEEKFPKAINKIVHIALYDKLRKINRDNHQKIMTRINNGLNRYCMLTTCDGKLESLNAAVYRCMKCETEFCKRCEMRKRPNHNCRQEDIEAVEFIATLVRCPGCKIPVQRSEGCPSITCANCGTLFEYTTGERGGHGSFNQPITVQTRYYLSNEYAEHYDTEIIKFLQKIESETPNVISIETILKLLIEIKKGNNFLPKLAKQFEKYINSKNVYKKYMDIVSTIEDLHEKQKLTLETLVEIYN